MMANEWLRLWHDMPNDPKWRTIARVSGAGITTVVSVYIHLLVDASRNVTRGHANVTPEDLASALDIKEDEIGSILAAMQGRVLDGMRLLGWEKRQPKREESGDGNGGPKSAAQRKAEERERKRLALLSQQSANDVTQSHAESRNVTLDKDKDKDNSRGGTSSKFDIYHELEIRGVDKQLAEDWITHRKSKKSAITATVLKKYIEEADKASIPLSKAIAYACHAGWQGFEAEWYLNRKGKQADSNAADISRNWE